MTISTALRFGRFGQLTLDKINYRYSSRHVSNVYGTAYNYPSKHCFKKCGCSKDVTDVSIHYQQLQHQNALTQCCNFRIILPLPLSEPAFLLKRKCMNHSNPLNHLAFPKYSQFYNCILKNNIHSASVLFKDESKVEKTVQSLKTEEKAKSEHSTHVSPAVKEEAKPSLGQRIIHELKHYYHGFRLLFIDIRICIRYIWMIMNGKSLTRRERRQLVRTTADMFRLVPFLVIILIPFMELALPIILKLFPNMLPSTFEHEDKKQEKIKKRLKAKLEMAKFLQDTIEETALEAKGNKKADTSKDFVDFMNKIRSTGSLTSNEEIMRFSKLFEDEITLDNMSRSQLAALCQVLELPTLGTTAFLRLQLAFKLRQLKADDKLIQREGIESLTLAEVQSACRARGMRSLGMSEARLRSQLSQWLDLHLEEKLPTSLLLLSRALYLPDTLSAPEQIKATISALPESTTEEAKIKAAEIAGAKVDNKTVRERIVKEEQALREEEEERKLAQLRLEEEKVKEVVEAVEKPDVLIDRAPEITTDTAEALKELEEIDSGDLEKLESVLDTLASEKKISMEQEELEELKEDVSEYKEDLEDLAEVVAGSSAEALRESRAAKLLGRRVDKLITQLDRSMQQLNKEREHIMERIEEQRGDEREPDTKLEEMKTDNENKRKLLVSLEDVLASTNRGGGDDSKLQRLIEALDEDRDGHLSLDEVYKVIELLGHEHIKITASQLTDVVQLIHVEEMIEDEEKEVERQEKETKRKQSQSTALQEDDNKTSTEQKSTESK